jgi:hypothetical protein
MSCDSYIQGWASFIFGPGGGRSWWAHFEFTRINIKSIILCKKIEDAREVGVSIALPVARRMSPAAIPASVSTTNC